MKQILQSLKTGKIEIANVPVPASKNNELLIKTNQTLLSSGTERMLVDFGKANWIDKARMQPDKLRMILDKIKTDGLQPTIDAVLHKLDQPLPLGYCNVGNIIEVGNNVSGFKPGDRIVSNGKHAEVVSVPTNLCAKIPENISDDYASFTVLASIALQSIRLVKPSLGETVVVTGLGLIGLLAVQLLRASGCRVLGLDYDEQKLDLAKSYGAKVINLSTSENPIKTAENFTRGRGVDAVIIAASTKSNKPVHQAALMCRKRGRIVLVGVTGLELAREDFYKKELTFQVSCSYGPGRYDPKYEQKGQDYPIGYVRWTEQRNFEAVLDMMSDGRLDVSSLISHRFDIENADKAYELVTKTNQSLGILLTYPDKKVKKSHNYVELKKQNLINLKKERQEIVLSFLGAGNYASAILIPAFKSTGVYLSSIASNSGVSGLHAARKFGFKNTTTDALKILTDDLTNTVVISTQHDTHCQFVIKALERKKNVFVEKPLCLSLVELEKINSTYNRILKSNNSTPILTVGFNRRFSPHIQKIKKLLKSTSGPKSFIMTINAGEIDLEHWTHDKEKGGGRIIGEVCHFIDLLRFLANSPIDSWSRVTMDTTTNDTVSINLKFTDGSIGVINYLCNGSKSFPKERLEVFVDGRVLKLDNFRTLVGFGWPGFKKMWLWKQDKGQRSCAQAFINSIKQNSDLPIPIEELIEVSRVTIEISK